MPVRMSSHTLSSETAQLRQQTDKSAHLIAAWATEGEAVDEGRSGLGGDRGREAEHVDDGAVRPWGLHQLRHHGPLPRQLRQGGRRFDPTLWHPAQQDLRPTQRTVQPWCTR
eukprot:3184505-Rhodomonas_salina.1